MRKRKTKKIGGLRLKSAMTESNLAAKCIELDRVLRLNSEIIGERDFLRKVVLQLSGRSPS